MGNIVREIYEGETQVIAFDYSDALPPGATEIDSAVLEAHEWVSGRPDEDVTLTFLTSPTGVIDGDLVKFQFQDPEAGKTYRVKSTTTFDDGQVAIDRILFEAVLA